MNGSKYDLLYNYKFLLFPLNTNILQKAISNPIMLKSRKQKSIRMTVSCVRVKIQMKFCPAA